MKDRHGQLLLVGLLVFLVVLALLLLLRHAVRETFVIPLLYLVWLGNLIFKSIPQGVFWFLLFLVAAILLFSSLRRKSQPEPVLPPTRRRQQQSRRVAHWAALVKRTAGPADESRRDAFALRTFRKLIVSVWAYRAHLSPREIERDIKSGLLEPPPECRFYFQDGGRSEEAGTRILRRALHRLRSVFRMRGSQASLSSNPHLHSLIKSLETEWEVERDR